MSRLTRTALVALFIFAAAAAAFTGGCAKKAPVLPPAVLATGVVPAKHPVKQDQAQKMGCSCHVEAAKAANGGK